MGHRNWAGSGWRVSPDAARRCADRFCPTGVTRTRAMRSRPFVFGPWAQGVWLARPTAVRLWPMGARRTAGPANSRSSATQWRSTTHDLSPREVMRPHLATRFRGPRRTAMTGRFTCRETSRSRHLPAFHSSNGELWSVHPDPLTRIPRMRPGSYPLSVDNRAALLASRRCPL